MIQRCCLCGTIYGHKGPFLDTSETTGMCGERYVPYLKKLGKQMEEYRTKQLRHLERSRWTSQPVNQE
jgi:hypothetical protein